MPTAAPPGSLCRRTLLAVLASWPAVQAVAAASARPLRLLVAGVAGGAADGTTRWLAEPLANHLGQRVIVEPISGAGGLLAVNALAAAPRDAHHFLVAVNSVVSDAARAAPAEPDVGRTIAPLCEIASAPIVLLAGAEVPPDVSTVAQLAAWVRAQGRPVPYASYSDGSLGHALGRQWADRTGLRLEHVPYRGSPPALIDLEAGRVPLMFDALPSCLPQLQAGRVRAYAVSSERRSTLLPGVPTWAEAGHAELSGTAWLGLWRHRAEPPALAEPLRRAALAALQEPVLRARILAAGFEPGRDFGPAELETRVSIDVERLRRAMGTGHRPPRRGEPPAPGSKGSP